MKGQVFFAGFYKKRGGRILLKTVALAVLLTCTVAPAFGHGGKMAADGCHYCRKNCEALGIPTDAKHCHKAFRKGEVTEQTIVGYPRIIDGDSIRIEKLNIRLHGIDAPEIKQQCKVSTDLKPCGRVASEVLADLIGDEKIRCLWSERDRYDRLLASCYVGEKNVNAEMVKLGMALAYRRYSDRYVEEEEYAKNAGLGLWATNFVEPWKWREGKR